MPAHGKVLIVEGVYPSRVDNRPRAAGDRQRRSHAGPAWEAPAIRGGVPSALGGFRIPDDESGSDAAPVCVIRGKRVVERTTSDLGLWCELATSAAHSGGKSQSPAAAWLEPRLLHGHCFSWSEVAEEALELAEALVVQAVELERLRRSCCRCRSCLPKRRSSVERRLLARPDHLEHLLGRGRRHQASFTYSLSCSSVAMMDWSR